MQLENGYEVPEGYESISCLYKCGFVIVWPVGNSAGIDVEIEQHYRQCSNRKRKTFRTKGE